MNTTRGRARHRLPSAPGVPARRAHTWALLAASLTGACGALAWTTGHTLSPHLPDPAVLTRPQVPPATPAPIRIAIPAIGVSANVEALHRNAHGKLQTPADWNHAGWYAEGVMPGDQGPAVIIGHVDSTRDGPAVFYHLRELEPGDTVLIDISDGHTQQFRVDTINEAAKTLFPTARVYGPTALPELRLITCTGPFDTATRSYLDNLIVTAHAA